MDQENLSKKKYKLALIDPPYLYDNMQQNDPKRGGITYSTMSLKDLSELPISNIMDDNSVIVVWVTFPKLCDTYEGKYDAMSMIKSWNYKPVTALFVWIKLNRKAHIINEDADPYWEEDKGDPNRYEHIKTKDIYSGLGRYTNSNVEFAIVARRGKGLPRLAKNVKQLIFAPIGNHSAKPQEQYNRLYRLFGDVPRIELFARSINPPPQGWDFTGLESTGEDIRDFLKQ